MKVCIFLVLVQVLWQGSRISSDQWLSHWTGDSSSKDQQLEAYNKDDTEHNMRVSAYLGASAAVMVLVRTLAVSFAGLRASHRLFDAITRSLLSAPLRFFDASPIGRIMNRYADDIATVDDHLPFAFGSVLANTFFTRIDVNNRVWFAECV